MTLQLPPRSLILILGGFLAGCVPGTGVRYEEAVERTATRLKQGVPTELFALKQRNGRGRTSFHFKSGNAARKVDLALPRWVRLEIISKRGGEDSYLTVEARREMIIVKPPDREVARRWRETILRALEER